VAWGGIDSLSNGALEVRLYRISDGGNFSLIGDEFGRDVRYAANGDRIVYTRYFAPTFDFGLEVINTNGTQQQPIRSTLPVLEAGQPDYCETANKVVFVAVPEQRPTGENIQFDVEPPTQVFIIDLDVVSQIAPGSEAPPNATIRLTSDSARYSYPAFSPDCSRVAVVRDDFNSAQAGPDVVVLDVNSPGSMTPITTDLTTFVESSPRWSRDGSQIAFSAAQATSPDNNDIVVASATGSGAPQVPIRSEADDILPVFSPDGAYLAFSSNRAGPYNIFIYRVSDGQLFQLTNSTSPVFVGGWWQ
jgi:dipeptidyl aminopeptidase/acylaminoacyl peptidase